MPEPVENVKITLASRPSGAPVPDNFRLERAAAPEPGEGELLLQILYLSLDPYMRGRMDDAKSYSAPVAIGGVMEGGTVARVVSSRNSNFAPGDIVLSHSGWQLYATSNGDGLRKLDPAKAPVTTALGVLGMPGFTAYTGLLKIGEPKAGETVVVAAASGAVGAVVGQIAKLKGCRVVGVAGGADKCAYVTGTLGFDACVDHHDPAFAAKLKDACPNGIDVYFENVGGAVFDAVWPLLNDHARVPVCGIIAHYNDAAYDDKALSTGRDRVPALMGAILRKRIRVQGFIILDHYATGYAPFLKDMSEWVAQGKVKTLEDVVPDLADAPQALIGLLAGKNFGKVVVRVGPDELA